MSSAKRGVTSTPSTPPCTPPPPPSTPPAAGSTDPFRPPSPLAIQVSDDSDYSPVTSPAIRTPQDFTLDSPQASEPPKTPPLPPLPPLDLPSAVEPIRRKSVFEGTDYRIPRKEPSLPPFLAPVPKRIIPIIPFSQQQHIQRTARRKETRAIRKKYNKENPLWVCKPCKASCFDAASKKAHLATRSHWLKAEAKLLRCEPCDFGTHSPEDFARHINGKRHKRKISLKK